MSEAQNGSEVKNIPDSESQNGSEVKDGSDSESQKGSEAQSNASEAQTSSEAPQPQKSSAPAEKTRILKDLYVENGRNRTMLCCQYCGAKILEKNSGTYMFDENATLPLMLQYITRRSGVQEEPIKEFFDVENIYTFDNIGFTHAVDNYKYLSCADCDTGPLGYYDLRTHHSYLALCRVSYGHPGE